MDFEEKVIPYLNGEKFSNRMQIKIANESDPIISKIDFLRKTVKDKTVLHIGFADHQPLIKEKIEKNNWIHKILMDNSKKCVGIDINESTVNYIKKEFNIENIYVGDITNDSNLDFITENVWDYAVLGDVLEHIDNPVLFLKSINEKYGKHIKCLIVTVPNAWELLNLRMLFKHKETLNTDHRFWFTPYTIAKVATCAGWKVSDFSYAQNDIYQKTNIKSILFRYITKKYPAIRETVVIKLTPQMNS